MQNIHVKRYNKPEAVGWLGTVEPEDRSWILFVSDSDERPPCLYLRIEGPVEGDGSREHAYVPTGVIEKRDTGEPISDEHIHQMGLTVRGSCKSPELLKEWDSREPHSAVLKAKEAVEEAMRVLREEHEAAVGQPKVVG